jgi:ribosomal protein S18 acetylase RimI-like enzyme
MRREVESDSPLDRAMWLAFSGPQRHLTVGDDRARRFAPGFSPIIIFPDRARPDFTAIEPHCAPGEHFYVEGWDGPSPAGWRLESETSMLMMVWAGGALPPRPAFSFRELDPTDTPAMQALVAQTNPGPFGPRTPELGDYIGVFDGDRLAAMAGERFHIPGYREISAVCTDPDYRGRGYANGLMSELMARQQRRGEIPFLHVMIENARARALYERMGFRVHHIISVRVLERLQSS